MNKKDCFYMIFRYFGVLVGLFIILMIFLVVDSYINDPGSLFLSSNYGKKLNIPQEMNIRKPCNEDYSWINYDSDKINSVEKRILSKKIIGKSQLDLLAANGICVINAHVNPGEPGKVYAQIYTAIDNIPLAHRWKVYLPPQLPPGWSKNPKEEFLYLDSTEIKAGSSEYKYPARFEIWFKPDNPLKHKRKLIEDIFWIQNWER